MTNPNDPAAPTNLRYVENDPQAGDYTCRPEPMYPGLTKREYFAIHIMQGLSANPAFATEKGLLINGQKVNLEVAAVLATDAIIRELSK